MKKNSSKKTVWVVDDDKGILDVVKIILHDEGYVAKIISDGKEFLKLIKTGLPDLILLDVFISNMNGREIVEKLKTDERTKFIPIILTTADVFAIKDAQKDKFKADSFLSKPFGLDELLQVIEKHL